MVGIALTIEATVESYVVRFRPHYFGGYLRLNFRMFELKNRETAFFL